MNEHIIAAVPIRSFRDGKTRLAPALEPASREALVRGMAERVLVAIAASGAIDVTLVVSPDDDVLTWAAGRPEAVVPVTQTSLAPGLDAAVAAGRRLATAHGGDALLSIFADLPFVTGTDIAKLVAGREDLILGTDRLRTGTNALFLRLSGPGKEFRFSFGHQSLEKHRAEARRIGLQAGVRHIPGIAFDLDTPEDWADVLALGPGDAALLEPALACEVPCQ